MSKKQMTLVYYYVPQDHDDEETPNVFGVMVSKNNIRLQHLYDNFPLKGSYIFRFKVMYDNIIAWLDLPQLDTKLPTFKDKIVVKATRISWQQNTTNPYGHYRTVKKDTTPIQQQAPIQKKQVPQSNPQTKQKSVPSPSSKLESTDLLSAHHEPVTTIPSDFDLLSTPQTTAKQDTKQTNSGMGDLLI